MIDERDDPEEITREEAKELIENVDAGTLVVAGLEPIPTLGMVDEDELSLKPTVSSYRFGDLDGLTAHADD